MSQGTRRHLDVHDDETLPWRFTVPFVGFIRLSHQKAWVPLYAPSRSCTMRRLDPRTRHV